MIDALDALHVNVRRIPLFYRVVVFTRIVLAAGFIPSGMVKVLGRRFTTISVESPIGALFEALYQTGAYWQFLGVCQVLAAVLLLIPRLAHLGALLFLPIITNILVITVALGFRGTPYVAGAMLFAVLSLSAWDYHRWRGLLTRTPLTTRVPEPTLDRWERLGFVVFALSFLFVFLATRDFASPSWVRAAVVTGFVAGVATLGRFLLVGRSMRVESRQDR